MRPYWIILLVVVVAISPVSASEPSEPYEDIVKFRYADALEVGDTFYWKLVTYRDHGKEVSDYPYAEGNTFTVKVTGDLNLDHKNLDITVNEDEEYNRILDGTSAPYFSGIIDHFNIILYQTVEFGNGSMMNYYDFQSTFYPGNSTGEDFSSQRIEGDEFVVEMSIKSTNDDGVTYLVEERYDYQTGVLNFHNHTDVLDDGTIIQDTLFIRLDNDPNSDESFLSVPGELVLVGPVVMGIIRRKRR